MSATTLLYSVHVQRVLETSRFFLGVGAPVRVLQLEALDRAQILQALQAGEHAAWGGWTLRATPARRVGNDLGGSDWVPGLWAASEHGFVSGLRIDLPSVHAACQFIEAVQLRLRAQQRVEDGYDIDLAQTRRDRCTDEDDQLVY